MKKVRLIAVIAALIAGVCIYLFLKELGKPQETPRTQIVVAAVNIPENTRITPEMVMLHPVATEALLTNHYLDPESVIGLVSSGDIFAGEQIISDRLVETGTTEEDSSTLAYVVEDGKRAVTVSVNAVTGIENLIKPGNHVDLIFNYSYKPAGSDDDPVTASRMFLQDLKVLAVGPVLSRDGAEEYVTVTLETTPEEAVLISYAEFAGTVRPILRSSLDDEKVKVREADLDVMRGEAPRS